MAGERTKGGNCYEVHGHAILGLGLAGDHEWLLCHGTVYHKAVGWHGHAWLELNGTCVDMANGNATEQPHELFYCLGRVKDVRRYTARQAGTMMLEHETYGPWEES